MHTPQDILIRKLKGHSLLDAADETCLRSLPTRTRRLQANEDFIHQGDKPQMAAVVIEGIVGRHHTLAGGRRQYLSFHMAGDCPDAQGLFLEVMDHGICAMGEAAVALIQHDHLRALFEKRPSVGFALWRETLIDAAMFRQAITNNSSRQARARLAHFFCELFYRGKKAGLTQADTLPLPLHQMQIGEALGLALVTVNRAMGALRRSGAMDFRNGILAILDWDTLATIGEFDPGYLRPNTPS